MTPTHEILACCSQAGVWGRREAREVGERVVALLEQLRRGLLEALAHLVHEEGDVRPRARGGVHQAADALLQGSLR